MPITSQAIHERLQSTARKFRWARSARFFIAGAALSLFFVILFLTLDAWVHFERTGRWAGLILIVTSLASGFGLGLRSWKKKISEEALARRIEAACSGSGNVLISAVQFEKSLPIDSPLRSAIFSEMRDPFPNVKWELVFDSCLLKKLAIVLAAVVAGLTGWAIFKPDYFANSAARIFFPAGNIAPLTRTRIESIIPGNDTVVRGRDVLISATLGGDLPASAWIHYREAGSSWQKALMDREAGQPLFGLKWKEVRQSTEYYIEAGDAFSSVQRLEVRPRTAIKTRTARITPPGYTGLVPVEFADFSVLQNVIPGSTVEMTFEFNNELAAFKAAAEHAAPVTVEEISKSRWKSVSRVFTNQTLKLDFTDTLGTADTAPVQIAVKVDEPPKITISQPGEGRDLVATWDATLTIQFTVTDLYGLGSVALYQSSNEKEDARLIQAWSDADGKKSFEASALISLKSFAREERVTFRVIAKDKNDVTGPGIGISRPIVVSLKSTEKLEKQVDDAALKLQKTLEALIKLQELNLDQSKVALTKQGAVTPLLERQIEIAESARLIVAAADGISPDVRNDIRALINKEMKDAVLALRNAAAPDSRTQFLNGAVALETMILARLHGSPIAAAEETKKGQVADLISGLEDLLKRQRILHKESTGLVVGKAPALATQQDALADKAAVVKKGIEADSKNATIGDEAFRQRLGRISGMFTSLKVYEEMLTAAEHLQTQKVAPAVQVQQRVIANLSRMVELLNQWQVAEAEEKAKELKKEAEEIKGRLDKIAEIQREIIEKTRDMARKNEFRAEDIATATEIQEQKDLMKEVIEQMTTDMHAFPDMKPGNEMKAELVSIFEDVQQTDKQDVAAGKLKPTEFAVQKEQGILDAIEAAKKIAADMEMFLPNHTETAKWLLENFDKTEMPDIPNLPLADAMEDIVGDLLDAQQELDNQDAASNQAFAMNPANGWEIMDGPQPGFGAQGKSGNEKPNHNEQMGRSSGGREGMSDGEMAGGEASNLKGDKVDARRTKDPLQQGQVKDDGGIGETKATGGGKAGGFSDRQGMEGNAPLRAVKAPPNPAASALAVKQAMLAEKTARAVGQASLLYMRSDRLAQVSRLMDENQLALKEGRMRDSQGLHQKIIGRLREIKSGVANGEVVSFPMNDSARIQDKQLLGGQDGDAPVQYKEMVADYFRALVEEK
ncbi:MAG: hypothetical protein JWL59_3758 [Chthoniobacteraceae bacterium]|nr:hypothetical protein [Chthoniobacteraceae bacterium]